MPRQRRYVKLTPEKHQGLIKELGVFFDQSNPPSSWPLQYVDIFRKIKDVEQLRFDKYKPDKEMGLLSVTEMGKRVLRLIRGAYNCRRLRENEATWRGHTEPEIVSRFDAEVICSICRKRIGHSYIQASPEDPTITENLQQRRAPGTHCGCNTTARAKEAINGQGEVLLFGDRIQWTVVHDPKERLEEKGVRLQQPDRIFGLSHTSSFEQCIASRPELRHSPFADGNVLYPFLLIEAKSEKGSPGFQSIESQAALPIRTLVKLQQDLAKASKTSLNPLLWFIANQGEEWRVYASISVGSGIRVIDLWHGTILSQNGALQLLLIMDYICDWARDIFRPGILQCLADGKVDTPEFSPAHMAPATPKDSSNASTSSSINLANIASSPQTPLLIGFPLDEEAEDTSRCKISIP